MNGGTAFFVDSVSFLAYNGVHKEKKVDRFPVFDFSKTFDLLIGVVIGLTLTIVVRAFLGI